MNFDLFSVVLAQIYALGSNIIFHGYYCIFGFVHSSFYPLFFNSFFFLSHCCCSFFMAWNKYRVYERNIFNYLISTQRNIGLNNVSVSLSGLTIRKYGKNTMIQIWLKWKMISYIRNYWEWSIVHNNNGGWLKSIIVYYPRWNFKRKKKQKYKHKHTLLPILSIKRMIIHYIPNKMRKHSVYFAHYYHLKNGPWIAMNRRNTKTYSAQFFILFACFLFCFFLSEK